MLTLQSSVREHIFIVTQSILSPSVCYCRVEHYVEFYYVMISQRNVTDVLKTGIEPLLRPR
jgi:hypothetical protein